MKTMMNFFKAKIAHNAKRTPDFGRTHEEPRRTFCPVCQYPIDAYTTIAEGVDPRPEPNEPVICAMCHSFVRYTNHGLVELHLEDVAQMPDEQRIELQRARRHMKA